MPKAPSDRYFNAIAVYRLASLAHRRGWTIVERLLQALIYLLFNCAIPASAEIGSGTFCGQRGIGVVIHPAARIGAHCSIGAGVVIGGGGKGKPGAPTIGNGCTIAVGAKVLGAVTIGDGAVIGANAVVLTDVPPGATAVGIPARVLR